jgi:hypothetical protein
MKMVHDNNASLDLDNVHATLMPSPHIIIVNITDING